MSHFRDVPGDHTDGSLPALKSSSAVACSSFSTCQISFLFVIFFTVTRWNPRFVIHLDPFTPSPTGSNFTLGAGIFHTVTHWISFFFSHRPHGSHTVNLFPPSPRITPSPGFFFHFFHTCHPMDLFHTLPADLFSHRHQRIFFHTVTRWISFTPSPAFFTWITPSPAGLPHRHPLSLSSLFHTHGIFSTLSPAGFCSFTPSPAGSFHVQIFFTLSPAGSFSHCQPTPYLFHTQPRIISYTVTRWICLFFHLSPAGFSTLSAGSFSHCHQRDLFFHCHPLDLIHTVTHCCHRQDFV
ncbi:unnamed protein product [Acanthosepion pharaonis]|uniref:Uncharacterized protein n=1 Tax=Acanthosepion pharaonis TaxID=158019 RepID=A0A812B8V3_ACAPH|nr:unnamed protein product [Sepia pharaonis]